MAETTAPRLAVVEVTGSRPDRPAYHAKVQVLNGTVVAAAELGGWAVTRLAAADMTIATLLAATADADAIVILGGEDITPRFYGGVSGYPEETLHFPVADDGQLALVRRALERGTPLLGICRGLQIINVALGGSIVQHLDEGIHRNVDVPIDRILREHTVELLEGTGHPPSLAIPAPKEANPCGHDGCCSWESSSRSWASGREPELRCTPRIPRASGRATWSTPSGLSAPAPAR